MSTHGRETGFGRPYGGPLPQSRRRILGVGVVLAVLLAVAALIVAILALTREPPPAPPPAASPSPQGPTTDADRKLCEAVAPLMKENDDRSNAFLGTGDPGSPEQDAALPKFVTDTQDWARRAQQVLDANANPPRLSTRTLQRYIDDMQLFVASVRPGPGTKYDEAAWTDSIVAYGGPLATCQALGVQW
jgi:Na+-transporting methylmalonyl-CoA/oxaloacetate decarboxylase gamma subunit